VRRWCRHFALPATARTNPAGRKIALCFVSRAAPIAAPARYQPPVRLNFTASVTHARHASQKKHSAASIGATRPMPKYTGRAWSSAAAANPAERVNHADPTRYISTLDASISADAAKRTPSSVSPNRSVPTRMTHATMGG
jgi:hypothetical protein